MSYCSWYAQFDPERVGDLFCDYFFYHLNLSKDQTVKVVTFMAEQLLILDQGSIVNPVFMCITDESGVIKEMNIVDRTQLTNPIQDIINEL